VQPPRTRKPGSKGSQGYRKKGKQIQENAKPGKGGTVQQALWENIVDHEEKKKTNRDNPIPIIQKKCPIAKNHSQDQPRAKKAKKSKTHEGRSSPPILKEKTRPANNSGVKQEGGKFGGNKKGVGAKK